MNFTQPIPNFPSPDLIELLNLISIIMRKKGVQEREVLTMIEILMKLLPKKIVIQIRTLIETNNILIVSKKKILETLTIQVLNRVLPILM